MVWGWAWIGIAHNSHSPVIYWMMPQYAENFFTFIIGGFHQSPKKRPPPTERKRRRQWLRADFFTLGLLGIWIPLISTTLRHQRWLEHPDFVRWLSQLKTSVAGISQLQEISHDIPIDLDLCGQKLDNFKPMITVSKHFVVGLVTFSLVCHRTVDPCNHVQLRYLPEAIHGPLELEYHFSCHPLGFYLDGTSCCRLKCLLERVHTDISSRGSLRSQRVISEGIEAKNYAVMSRGFHWERLFATWGFTQSGYDIQFAMDFHDGP